MGLESVELVISIEEHFEISIPDAAAEKMTAVGALVDYVHALFSAEERVKCNSAHAFYELRRALVEILQVPRKEIRPARKIIDVFPRDKRHLVWKQLSKRGMKASRLNFSRTL